MYNSVLSDLPGMRTLALCQADHTSFMSSTFTFFQLLLHRLVLLSFYLNYSASHGYSKVYQRNCMGFANTVHFCLTTIVFVCPKILYLSANINTSAPSFLLPRQNKLNYYFLFSYPNQDDGF